jgi:hypothetical protein
LSRVLVAGAAVYYALDDELKAAIDPWWELVMSESGRVRT